MNPPDSFRARAAIAMTFISEGAVFGAWAGATPSIMAATGISKEAMGYGIAGFTIAYGAAMFFGGGLARRLSNRGVLILALPFQAAMAALMLTAGTTGAFLLVLPILGIFLGLVDLTMNAEATALEQETGRPILSGFHAAASFGVAAAAIASGAAANLFGTWAVALVLAGVCAAAWLAVVRWLPTHVPPVITVAGAAAVRPLAALALLGLVVGLSIAAETTALVWSGKLLAELAPSLAALAGAGACFFGLFQAVMRLAGDRVRARAGDRQTIQASLAVAVAGFAGIALAQGFAASLVGFALVGAGTACLVPCLFAWAARLEPHDRAGALGVVALTAGLPRIALPIAFGVAAERASTGAAFGLCALSLVAAFLALAAIPRRATRLA